MDSGPGSSVDGSMAGGEECEILPSLLVMFLFACLPGGFGLH